MKSAAVLIALTLSACSVKAGNPKVPGDKIIHIDQRVPSSALSGRQVVVRGRNFGSATGEARFGSQNAKVLSWRDDEVTFEAPASATGTCDALQLAGSGGEVSNSVPFSYGEHDVWVPLRDVPAPRMGHTAVWTGDEMLVLGGRTGWRYNPRTDSWMPTVTPAFQLGAGGTDEIWENNTPPAIWTGSQALVWSYGHFVSYDPNADAYARLASAPAAVAWQQGQTVTFTGANVVLWGNHGGASYRTRTNDWVTFPPFAEALSPKRLYHSAIWTGEDFIVWGGKSGSWDDLRGTGAIYHNATQTWRAMSTEGAPSPRAAHHAVWTGSEMIVWGGLGLGESHRGNDGAIYNPRTDTWRPMTPKGAPLGSIQASVVWTGDRMLVYGGFRFPNTVVNQVVPEISPASYDPVADRWETLPEDQMPIPRTGQSAVWTDEEMIVWGGITYGTQGWQGVQTSRLLNSGGRYAPKLRRWTPTATASNEPAPRYAFHSHWTGQELIVWGGLQYNPFDETSSMPVADGAKYNPALNAWLPINNQGSPHVGFAASVWTGEKMLISGGVPFAKDNNGFTGFITDATGAYATGAISAYDPAADQWTELVPSGPPILKRVRHRAVWDGTDLILWGGSSRYPSHYSEDWPPRADQHLGVRFSPSAMTWSALPVTGAPEVSFDQTAVWADGEMIVWGGTGARYVGATNTWRPMAAAPLNGMQALHTSLWSGRQLFIVGGQQKDFTSSNRWAKMDENFVSMGAAYDPETDQWTLLDLGGIATKRNPTVAWTGSSLLVYNGIWRSPESFDNPARRSPAGYRWSKDTGKAAVIQQVCTYDAGEIGNLFSPNTAAWIGDRMLTWGPFGPAEYFP